MRLLSVGGTRPQFIKMAVLVRSVEEHNQRYPGAIEHRLLHTGQHKDPIMSDIFFEDLGMPQPRTLKMCHTRRPGLQTALMLAEIETELLAWRPDGVVTYGDTNSALSCALATAKLHIPLIHLEAGLRSFNRLMQEELNRIVIDHISDLLLCPTRAAVDRLHYEGLGKRAAFVGDVMLDAVEIFGSLSRLPESLEALRAEGESYALLTLHRAETTDHPTRLESIFRALRRLDLPVVFPMHPRLRARLAQNNSIGNLFGTNIHIIQPLGYLEMLAVQRNARFIMTDSGGLQKEAYFMGTPCVTLREETEWRETLHGGWNTLVGSDTEKIVEITRRLSRDGEDYADEPRNLRSFGGGNAGKESLKRILETVRAA